MFKVLGFLIKFLLCLLNLIKMMNISVLLWIVSLFFIKYLNFSVFN